MASRTDAQVKRDILRLARELWSGKPELWYWWDESYIPRRQRVGVTSAMPDGTETSTVRVTALSIPAGHRALHSLLLRKLRQRVARGQRLLEEVERG